MCWFVFNFSRLKVRASLLIRTFAIPLGVLNSHPFGSLGGLWGKKKKNAGRHPNVTLCESVTWTLFPKATPAGSKFGKRSKLISSRCLKGTVRQRRVCRVALIMQVLKPSPRSPLSSGLRRSVHLLQSVTICTDVCQESSVKVITPADM